jgi:membrane protease YdiL (CAAX protease family)
MLRFAGGGAIGSARRPPCGSVRPVEAEPARETFATGPAGGGKRAAAFDSAPRPHRWGLGAFVLVTLTYLAVSALLAVFWIGTRPMSAGILALALVVPTATAAGLAMLVTQLRGNGPRTDLRLAWSWYGLRIGLRFGFGGLLVTIPASLVYASIVGPGANSTVGRMFSGLRASWPWAVTVFLIVVVVAPLCEEIIFRGLLWGALDRRWGQWVAMVVSTVVFAFAHLEFTRAPLLVVVAIPLALARWYSGGLLASIVAHQVTNLLPGIVLMLGLVGIIPSS